MYKVTVKTCGKYNNVVPGARYCFTKHSAIELAITFTAAECEFEVAKLVRIHRDIFMWSAAEVSWKIWEKVKEAFDNESEE